MLSILLALCLPSDCCLNFRPMLTVQLMHAFCFLIDILISDHRSLELSLVISSEKQHIVLLKILYRLGPTTTQACLTHHIAMPQLLAANSNPLPHSDMKEAILRVWIIISIQILVCKVSQTRGQNFMIPNLVNKTQGCQNRQTLTVSHHILMDSTLILYQMCRSWDWKMAQNSSLRYEYKTLVFLHSNKSPSRMLVRLRHSHLWTGSTSKWREVIGKSLWTHLVNK